jgi:hypothetical protein
VVLVDHASEDLAAVDRAGEWGDGRRVVVRRTLLSPLVRSMVVDVAGERVERGGGVAFAVEEDPVGALLADRADESLRVAVRSWCPRRGAHDLDAFGGEDVVERLGVFRVPVADEEPEPVEPSVQVHGQVACLLGRPGSGRVAGCAEDVDAATADLHDEQDVEPAQGDGVEVEEVGGQQSAGLGATEGAPGGVGVPARRGAGPRPAPARIRRIVPAPIGWPSARSSPWMRRCPQVGLSRARRITSVRRSSCTGGRPVRCG